MDTSSTGCASLTVFTSSIGGASSTGCEYFSASSNDELDPFITRDSSTYLRRLAQQPD